MVERIDLEEELARQAAAEKAALAKWRAAQAEAAEAKAETQKASDEVKEKVQPEQQSEESSESDESGSVDPLDEPEKPTAEENNQGSCGKRTSSNNDQVNWTVNSQRSQVFIDNYKAQTIIYTDITTQVPSFALKDSAQNTICTVSGFPPPGVIPSTPVSIMRYNRAPDGGNFDTDFAIPVFIQSGSGTKQVTSTGGTVSLVPAGKSFSILQSVTQPEISYDRSTDELILSFWSNADEVNAFLSTTQAPGECDVNETPRKKGGSVDPLTTQVGVVQNGRLDSTSSASQAGEKTSSLLYAKFTTVDRVLYYTQGRPYPAAFINYSAPNYPPEADVPLPYGTVYIFNEPTVIYRKKGGINEFNLNTATTLFCDNTNPDCTDKNISTRILDGECKKEGDLDDLTLVDCFEARDNSPSGGSGSGTSSSADAPPKTPAVQGNDRWMMWLNESLAGGSKDTIKGGLLARRSSKSGGAKTPKDPNKPTPTLTGGSDSGVLKQKQGEIDSTQDGTETRAQRQEVSGAKNLGRLDTATKSGSGGGDSLNFGMLRDVMHITDDDHAEIRTSAHFAYNGMFQKNSVSDSISGPIAMMPYSMGAFCQPGQFNIDPYAVQGCYVYRGYLYWNAFTPPLTDFDDAESCICVDDYEKVKGKVNDKTVEFEGRPISSGKDIEGNATTTYQLDDGSTQTLQNSQIGSNEQLKPHVRKVSAKRLFPLHGFWYPAIESAVYFPKPGGGDDDQNGGGDDEGEDDDPTGENEEEDDPTGENKDDDQKGPPITDGGGGGSPKRGRDGKDGRDGRDGRDGGGGGGGIRGGKKRKKLSHVTVPPQNDCDNPGAAVPLTKSGNGSCAVAGGANSRSAIQNDETFNLVGEYEIKTGTDDLGDNFTRVLTEAESAAITAAAINVEGPSFNNAVMALAQTMAPADDGGDAPAPSPSTFVIIQAGPADTQWNYTDVFRIPGQFQAQFNPVNNPTSDGNGSVNTQIQNNLFAPPQAHQVSARPTAPNNNFVLDISGANAVAIDVEADFPGGTFELRLEDGSANSAQSGPIPVTQGMMTNIAIPTSAFAGVNLADVQFIDFFFVTVPPPGNGNYWFDNFVAVGATNPSITFSP